MIREKLLKDNLDGQLLNLMQVEFPLVVRPFEEMGRRLGMADGEALNRVKQMKAGGLIRRVGVVIDWRRLGFRSTLVALRLPEERLDAAASIISQHPGVTHNYGRQHHFNLWFTLTVPPEDDPEVEAQILSARAGAEAAVILPSIRVFKITANFNMVDSGSPILEVAGNGSAESAPPLFHLSSEDRAVIRALNRELPLDETPFEAAAGQVGLTVERLLERARSLKEAKVVRRYGAVVHHVRAGFKSNALSCWKVPAGEIEAIGAKVASFPTVSHCYERKTGGGWYYNLFAMLHASTEDACRSAARDIASATGIADYLLLFTQHEYKKERLGYLDD
ncbi:MAG: transcriptional regulator, AsnC family [Dehalococcoidia bacterium]|nr:transcriptional regulator, AsnC family [Dehalococcoidia bacterium]